MMYSLSLYIYIFKICIKNSVYLMIIGFDSSPDESDFNIVTVQSTDLNWMVVSNPPKNVSQLG